MKSVLKSAFDPMPKVLSTKGLFLLVGVLVLGTGLSVHAYLKGATPVAWAADAPATNKRVETCPKPEATPTRSRTADKSPASSSAAAPRTTVWDRFAPAPAGARPEESALPAASSWGPEDASTGG